MNRQKYYDELDRLAQENKRLGDEEKEQIKQLAETRKKQQRILDQWRVMINWEIEE